MLVEYFDAALALCGVILLPLSQLKQKILDFIAYCNLGMAKLFGSKEEGYRELVYAGGLLLPSWSS